MSDLDHLLVKEAQRLPDTYAAGGVERILALTDRVWFKVKEGRWRGAAIRLPEGDQPQGDPQIHLAPWWLGAGGYRRDGDPSDFYASMAAAARRDGKHQEGGSSDRWLPDEWDWKRLELEHATAWIREIRRIVCLLIVRSLRTGQSYQAVFQGYSITVLARAEGGETYLAIGTENIAGPKIFAVIMSAVPGIDSDAWLAEPGGVVGLAPAPGEIIWSTILPPTVAAELLDGYTDEGN
ncbi:hypothetical protein ACI2K4_15335 [Micromonospora sp. NPDC050397]|uniref:hypothetical protein n=1 Tax=Micromonospora sp. NPDC050397 TaxID=3364279 RepID=UPI00384B9078